MTDHLAESLIEPKVFEVRVKVVPPKNTGTSPFKFHIMIQAENLQEFMESCREYAL